MILSWAISFCVFALTAVALGFSHAAATMTFLAKTCFVMFVVLGLVRPLSGADRSPGPTPTCSVSSSSAGVG